MDVIITIGPDGTIAVAGPYTSSRLAHEHAGNLMKAVPGLNAEVHSLTTPRELATEIRNTRG